MGGRGAGEDTWYSGECRERDVQYKGVIWKEEAKEWERDFQRQK